MIMEKKTDRKTLWDQYEEAVSFKTGIRLYDTVDANENFYVGKQWEGVQANGLPTPVFNFIKRIVLFLVASTATDSIKINASPLSSTSPAGAYDVEQVCDIVNAQFEALFEQNKLSRLSRDFMRNAAVDGDGCLYSYFDPEAETGQTARGTIRTELLQNTRVAFGNPGDREVQSQPWILISRRELVSDVKREARENGGEPDSISCDTDEANDRFDAMTDGKVTTVLKFWKDEDTGRVLAMKATRNGVVRPQWDTGMRRYPIAWMSWDYVQNCYHGQAAVTGLIPNQIFVNKMFAMAMISLMSTAYPKVVYDRTRVRKWDGRVGAAIGVNGGDVGTVARIIDPAAISPQVSQFIELAIGLTKEFLGATDAALGEVRPENTSAIIALQKASSVPMELTKQNFYQCLEDLARNWLDQMRAYYGTRYVERKPTAGEKRGDAAGGQSPDDAPRPTPFDFSTLEEVPLSLKLDVGGSAYWSEIAQMQTLDNLLMKKEINIVDYLERVPNGYISNQQELIRTLRERQTAAQTEKNRDQGANMQATAGGSGSGQLQRLLSGGGTGGAALPQAQM